MEILILLLTFLFFVALVVGVISLIVLIVMAVRKKRKKAAGIVTASSFVLAFIFLVSLVTVTINVVNEYPTSTPVSSSTSSSSKTSSSSAVTDSDEESEYDKNFKEIREEREAAEEESEKEEAEKERAAEEDYQHEVIDGIDVFTTYSDIILTPNVFMSNFSVDMSELLNEKNKELSNGVIFRNATTLTDKYGNEDKLIVVGVWYSQETIEKINFDNWPQLIGEDLYNTADSVLVHYTLGQSVDVENKQNENAPQIFKDSIGSKYE